MQVPPDLVSRLQYLAMSRGSSAEVFLRDAISKMMDDVAESQATIPAPGTMAIDQTPHLHTAFVPQALSVSVYE